MAAIKWRNVVTVASPTFKDFIFPKGNANKKIKKKNIRRSLPGKRDSVTLSSNLANYKLRKIVHCERAQDNFYTKIIFGFVFECNNSISLFF